MSIETLKNQTSDSEVMTWGEWKQMARFHEIALDGIEEHDPIEIVPSAVAIARLTQFLAQPKSAPAPVPDDVVKFEDSSSVSKAEVSTDEMKLDEWKDEYLEYKANPPKEGDRLFGLNGQPVKLIIELKPGAEPFIYGQVYLHAVVGEKIEWYATSIKDEKPFGWKAILDRRSRDEIINRFGLRSNIVSVKSIDVIRWSLSGNSIVCTVGEYL